VLTLDFAVPAEAGPAFVGLEPAAWWCPDESASILSAALAERIGIPLRNIELSRSADVFHELKEQVSDPGPGVAAASSAPAPAPDPGSGGLGARNALPPVIVDCDLQVRERLRFLIWMRRVQAESQRELEAQH
jgi:hypothetical protein